MEAVFMHIREEQFSYLAVFQLLHNTTPSYKYLHPEMIDIT